MKKQKRQFKIDYDLDWEYGVKISKLREDLDAIEKLGAKWIDIDAEYVIPVCERIETDAEYNERIADELAKIGYTKQKELNQLKYLKDKYE